MSPSFSSEHSRRREQHRVAESIKRNLAKSVLVRVHEEVASDADVREFTTPLLRTNDVALRILRNHPDVIARRVDIGRSLSLELDESVEPPLLRISLGEVSDDSDQAE